jgi:hypothetical protein
MYLNLEIISNGYQSILLGPSVPINSLVHILSHYEKITFISYLTVKPEREDLMTYLNEFEEKILKSSHSDLWLLGRMVEFIDTKKLHKSVKIFKNIEDLVSKL